MGIGNLHFFEVHKNNNIYMCEALEAPCEKCSENQGVWGVCHRDNVVGTSVSCVPTNVYIYILIYIYV
jgi:hypothetical protein